MVILLSIALYLVIGLVIDLMISGQITIFTPVVMVFWPIAILFGS